MKTPYFIIDKNSLEENLSNMLDGFVSKLKNCIIGYSLKTNSLPWIVRFLYEKGCYIEVVSRDEFELAKYLKIPLNKIIYNGPIKSKDSVLEIINGNGILNIDSFEEINWLKETKSKKIKVGLRVNIDLEHYCPTETWTGENGSRFGFSYENGELGKVIKILENIKNIQIVGIHCHNTTKTRSLNIYKTLTKEVVNIIKSFKLNIEYIDIGGGFYGGVPKKPTYKEYAEVIYNELKQENLENKVIIFEPGSAMIASSISFVAEIKSVKEIKNKKIIVTNASCNCINPFIQDKIYEIEYYNSNFKQLESRQIVKEQVLCGYTCLEKDILIKLKNKQELKVGDKIIFKKMGAYTSTLSPLFIEYFPDIYLKDGKEYFIIRKRWTVKEFIQNCVVETDNLEKIK